MSIQHLLAPHAGIDAVESQEFRVRALLCHASCQPRVNSVRICTFVLVKQVNLRFTVIEHEYAVGGYDG